MVTRGALGNKSGSFCEAVNCERSEQEGKFLFVMLVAIRFFIIIIIMESAESGGTIYLDLHRMDTLVTIR